MACCSAFNASWFWKRRAEVETRCSDNPWDVMGTGEGAGGGIWLQLHWIVMVPAAIRSAPASLGAREQLAGAIYHFGVYNGRSLRELLNWFPFAPHYAFDSFVGLPRSIAERVLDKHDKITIRGKTTYLSMARGGGGGFLSRRRRDPGSPGSLGSLGFDQP